MKAEPCPICGRTPEAETVSIQLGGPPETAFSAVVQCQGSHSGDPWEYHTLMGPYEDGPNEGQAMTNATVLWNRMVIRCRKAFTNQQTS